MGGRRGLPVAGVDGVVGAGVEAWRRRGGRKRGRKG